MRHLLPFVLFCAVTMLPAQNLQLSFEQIQIVAHDAPFRETRIGGLSGIEFDTAQQVFYLVADKPPARYYHAQLNERSELDFVGITFLQPEQGENESIRLQPNTRQLYLSDERSKKALLFQNVVNGQEPKEISLPKKYRKMQHNSGLEGMCFSPDGKYLYLGLERPLKSERKCNNSRILKLDAETGQAIAEYAYPLANLDSLGEGGNGITELVYWKDQKLLVMERAYFPHLGRNSVRIYLVDLASAKNVGQENICKNLDRSWLLEPQLLWNADDDIKSGKLKRIDNMEGMCWGSSKSELWLVSDNNFNTRQQTQIIRLKVQE